MKANQIQPGDKLNGKEVTEVNDWQKNNIQIKTEGQRRGMVVHRTTDLNIQTDRPVSG